MWWKAHCPKCGEHCVLLLDWEPTLVCPACCWSLTVDEWRYRHEQVEALKRAEKKRLERERRKIP
jgi:uncharacterized Zn finger protein (UPF0148 family)